MTQLVDQPVAKPFLDVPTLLEASEPHPRIPWGWYGLGVFLLFLTLSEVVAGQSVGQQIVSRILSSIAMVLLLGSLPVTTFVTVSRSRAERLLVERISELVQTHRWQEAAFALQRVLSSPLRSAESRAQALLLLCSVLTRYERFEDALAVQEYLLGSDAIEPSAAYALRLGRAMSMLHLDRLFDADRAIAELRRLSGGGESAPLTLVELYRDVKTGHPLEAAEMFESRLQSLRWQLGHRVADGWALAARAYDMLGREAEARLAVLNATVLAPAGELLRRYPELRKMVGRYDTSMIPAGVEVGAA